MMIKLLALDIDGVITNGTTTLSPGNSEQKLISFHDLDAVTKAQKAGLHVVLITGEDNLMVERIAQRFNVQQVSRGAKNKLTALENVSAQFEIPLTEICYVGDSDRDAPALSKAGLGIAPANATSAAKAAADRVLLKSGGDGVVADVVALLEQLRMDEEQFAGLAEVIQHILNDSLKTHQRLLDESLPTLVKVAQVFTQAIATGRKILLFGNGGSAADAQHVAGEMVGRFLQESEPWPVIALTTDTSIITAVGNDLAFDDVFGRQVRALARPGDVVVGISTSGNSPNVIKAMEEGRKKGATVIGFTGMDGGKMMAYCEVCFRAPADKTPRIQELHILAWHAICEVVERELVERYQDSV
ncbi:MAG: SIS domain-containing protein [Chloroflexota bacterium]